MKKERKCRKCGDKIPWVTRINGKRKLLRDRKFCLKCSPWGENNTYSDDPLRKPQSEYKNSVKYKDFSDSKKMLHKARVLKKSYDRKDLLVKMSGGGCIVCGYNKSLRALSFHHREPEKKEFPINISTLGKKWELIMEEYKKCDLLCMNCHAEVEEKRSPMKQSDFEEIIRKGKKKGYIVKGKIKRPKKSKKCLICRKDFHPKRKTNVFCSRECHHESMKKTCILCGKGLNKRQNKFCSYECSKGSTRKVPNRPSISELQEMLKTMSYCAVGRKYGVSDNAVRKWLK